MNTIQHITLIMLFNFFEFCTYSCQAEFEYSDSAEETADYYQLCPPSDLSLHLQPAGHPSNDHRRGHHPQAVLGGESHQDLGRGEAEPTQTCQPCNFISLSPVLINSRTFMFEYIYTKSFIQNHFSYHIIDWIMFKFQFAIAKKTQKNFL